ncbi:MAG: hypothetical protein ABJJ53_09620 [Sulfitobacter sp.]
MALNIPVNLMATVTPQAQPPTAAPQTEITAKVQPTSNGAETRHSGLENSTSRERDWYESKSQIEVASVSMTEETPDTPEPSSITSSELDRYAPPNPLPTAPILQAAASYAANREDI